MASENNKSEDFESFMDKGEKGYELQEFINNSSDVDEKERLNFAKLILLGLFFLVLVVFFCSYNFVNEANGNKDVVAVVNTILDITKTAVPSIVTLVLGFYFGKKES